MAAHVRLSYEGARNHAALISDALIRTFALGFLVVWKVGRYTSKAEHGTWCLWKLYLYLPYI